MSCQTFAAAEGHLVYRIILLEGIRFVRIRIKRIKEFWYWKHYEYTDYY